MATDDTIDPGFVERLRPTRYDLVLAVIPAAILVAALLATVLSLPVRVGIVAGSIVAAAALVDALFLNPPRGRRPGPAPA